MELRTDSPICEDLGIMWLNETIKKLNSILKQNGVTERQAREEILSSFFFDLAAEFDGSPVTGIEFEGKEYRPILGFCEEATSLLHTSKAYDLHDYVYELLEEEN